MIKILVDCPEYNLGGDLRQAYNLKAEFNIAEEATTHDCLDAFIRAMRLEGYHIDTKTLQSFIEEWGV